MKLSGAQAAAFCRAPDPSLAGVLLHGEDGGLVAGRRRELTGALVGPSGDGMRLERLEPAAIRRDPSTLEAALRSRGFFGGRGLIVVDGATDTLADVVEAALGSVTVEDSFVVLSAGLLTAKSSLRRVFEGSRRLLSLQILAEVPEPAEIRQRLASLGAGAGATEGAMELLATIAAGMDPSGFDRFLETLATFGLGATLPLDATNVAALAPSGLDADVDAFIAAVATGRAEAIGPLLRRVMSTGATPVSLLLGLQRHFRQLLLAASAEGGPEAGMARLRPPVWGPRRNSMRAQLAAWRRDRLEAAGRLLFEADGRVRSAERVPALALVERCALRLAMMAGR